MYAFLKKTERALAATLVAMLTLGAAGCGDSSSDCLSYCISDFGCGPGLICRWDHCVPSSCSDCESPAGCGFSGESNLLYQSESDFGPVTSCRFLRCVNPPFNYEIFDGCAYYKALSGYMCMDL